MSKDFGFYVNGGELNNVNIAQQENFNRFMGIMQQLQDVAYETKTNWSGAGRESNDADESEFSEQYEQVIDAFSHLIGNSEEAGENFQQMMTKMSNRFQ